MVADEVRRDEQLRRAAEPRAVPVHCDRARRGAGERDEPVRVLEQGPRAAAVGDRQLLHCEALRAGARDAGGGGDFRELREAGARGDASERVASADRAHTNHRCAAEEGYVT